MRRLSVLAAVLAAAAVSAGAATAAKPVVVEKNNEFTRHFAGIPLCPGFTVTADFQIRRTITRYYDNEGNLLREVVHVHFTGTNTNDESGKSLPVNGVRHIVFDFVNNTFTETGVLRHVTVPGSGIVLHESGRLVTSLVDDSLIFMAGPHQEFTGDVEEFCAALAGP